VKIDISGVNEKDIHLSFNGHILDISGTKEKGNTGDKVTYLVRERLSGRFHRSIHLPLFVDSKGLKTRYEKGVLEVLVPKRKGSTKRAIKTGIG
jgi:HSP20 family protein